MNILKRTLSLFVGTSLLVLMSAVTASADYNTTTKYQDVADTYPYYDAIKNLQSSGVIHGYEDGNFLPDNTINRAEFVKVVIASLTKDPKGNNCFKDVKTEWFAPYVCEAKSRGIIQGYANGTFQPDLNISIVEASKILALANGLKDSKTKPDMNDPWYKRYVEALELKNAIPVSIDYPEKKITRGEVVEMAWRIKSSVTTKSSKTYASLTSDLSAIESCSALKDKISMQSYRLYRPMGLMMKSTMVGASPEEAVISPAPTVDSANTGASEKSTGDKGGALTEDFSTTNVQVQGVDEADIIKNDGQYIYMIKGRSIRIVKASPASDMKELSRTVVDETSYTPNEMFVTGNTLVVVGNAYAKMSETVVYMYDITDRSNPKQLRRLSFEGSYVSSRRIGQYAYFVMNAYPRYELLQNEGTTPIATDAVVPRFTDSKNGKTVPVTGCTSIRVFPRYDEPNFLIVAGVALNDAANSSVSKQVYLGSGSTVYSSSEGLYVATQKYEYNDNQIYNIWAPPITKTSTVFHRFALNNGQVEFKTNGTVPGTLLNQFSMDESGNAFRVATSQGDFWNPNSQPTNQLYVLDKNNLSTVLGKVEDIGKGEKIKAVRFMGKRAYVVTFKNTDPFFVIDVENPSAPKILGELKIPGYSDYLHPYDENHIIGFGKEAVDASQFK
ncbi:beta-propeller domain-containing protein, partial [Candidatus Gracilibacteria bacterium]|nr:beta-propeller domain-containing protein [Candidatus Gracilibacteria bacterium]